MVGAALYILVCSARNRMRRRLQRLREPRYLVGAAVGSAYLFFMVVGRWGTNRPRRARDGRALAPVALLPAFGGAGPPLAGLALLGAAAVSWLMPLASGLLEYSASEVALLFPAPVTRRQLLTYRLMHAQWAVFVGAAIFALTYPVATLSARIRGLIGAWLLLMTCHVFFTGVTLARTALRFEAKSARRVAWPPLVVTGAGVLTIAVAFTLSVWRQPVQSAEDVAAVLRTLASSGIPGLVLWPYTAIVRPLFAESFVAFVLSLPGALAVYAVTVFWVLRADETLDLVTEDSVAKDRSGSPRSTAYRAAPIRWTLGLRGRPETPFIWKSAAQTLRVVDARVLGRMAFLTLAIVLVVALSTRTRGLAQALAIFAAIVSGFAVLMLPQILRQDLRQDLQHLDWLKTWPVRPAAVIRGEIAWPAMVTTALTWVTAIVAIALSAAAFSARGLAARTAFGIAGMILAPVLICAQYTIHNAAALFFPAWSGMGRARARGVGATGQRLIVVSATWILLFVAFLPGLVIGWILWIALYTSLGPWVLVPAAISVAAIVGLEVWFATEALGPAYERLDITSVERAE